MGWTFLETVGDKVAEASKKTSDAMAKALADKVEQSGLDIEDLEIEFSAGVATISGIAADAATVEKAVLIVGNTEGVSEVEADGFVAGVTEAEKAGYAKARADSIEKARLLAAERAKDAADAEKVAAAAAAEKAARRELRKRRRKAQAAAAKSASKFYTVVSGDTLSKIAKEFYGDGSKYPVVFEANKPMLKSADLIYPGQVLRIPPLDA